MIGKRVFSLLPGNCVWAVHHVKDNPTFQMSNCLLSTERFKSLTSNPNLFISLHDAIKFEAKNRITITFDDGLSDVYSVAYPILKDRKIPFSVFIISGFLGEKGYISKEQLKEMSRDPLITIGSHGTYHQILTEITPSDARKEINDSKLMLEDLLGKEVSYYAYSHGQYNSSILDMAKIYDAAFTVRSLPVNFVTLKHRYALPRFNVDNNSYSSIMEAL